MHKKRRLRRIERKLDQLLASRPGEWWTPPPPPETIDMDPGLTIAEAAHVPLDVGGGWQPDDEAAPDYRTGWYL